MPLTTQPPFLLIDFIAQNAGFHICNFNPDVPVIYGKASLPVRTRLRWQIPSVSFNQTIIMRESAEAAS
jgi:hypothetical protein